MSHTLVSRFLETLVWLVFGFWQVAGCYYLAEMFMSSKGKDMRIKVRLESILSPRLGP